MQAKSVVVQLRVQFTRLQVFSDMNKGSVLPPPSTTVPAGCRVRGRKRDASFMSAELEPWVEVRDATCFGYGMLRIFNRTDAQWEWIHTGEPEDRDYNVVFKSDEQLPAGPHRDNVDIRNQYFL